MKDFNFRKLPEGGTRTTLPGFLFFPIMRLLDRIPSPVRDIFINGVSLQCQTCRITTTTESNSLKEVMYESLVIGWTIKKKDFYCPTCSQ